MSALSSTKLFVSWAGLALVVGALGCSGSDDDTQTGGKSGSGGSDATGGSGGSSTGGTGGATGGTAGATGGSGGAGGAVSPDGGEIVCNGVICPPTMFGGMSVPACCTMQNTCGVSAAGNCFPSGGGVPEAGSRGDGAGVIDPSCASLMLAVGATLAGCCMPDNNCGFSSQVSGCVSLETLRGLGLPGINLPDGGPMSCVYPPN
jgi:hypothetical protein